MTWNYRIIRTNIGTKKKPIFHFGIYEVYYSRKWNPTYWSAEVQKPETYHNVKDLKVIFAMMRQALKRDVLEVVGKKKLRLKILTK